jgi:hypothetical protein
MAATRGGATAPEGTVHTREQYRVNSTLGPQGPPVGPTAQKVLAQRPGRF